MSNQKYRQIVSATQDGPRYGASPCRASIISPANREPTAAGPRSTGSLVSLERLSNLRPGWKIYWPAWPRRWELQRLGSGVGRSAQLRCRHAWAWMLAARLWFFRWAMKFHVRHG